MFNWTTEQVRLTALLAVKVEENRDKARELAAMGYTYGSKRIWNVIV